MTRFRALQRGAELRQLTAATDERSRRAGERLTFSLRSDTGRCRRLIHGTESSPRGPMVPDGGWWLVVGGWWLVVGGWWLVVGGWCAVTSHQPHITSHQTSARGLRRHTAKAALSRFEDAQCLTKLLFPELGPHRLGEVELRVRALPEHEVAQSLLTACPDEQIDIPDRARIVVDFGE